MFFKGEISPSACSAFLSALQAARLFAKAHEVLVVVDPHNTFVTNNITESEDDPVSDKPECTCRLSNNYLWRPMGFELSEARLVMRLSTRGFVDRLEAARDNYAVRLKVDNRSISDPRLHCEVVGQSQTSYVIEILRPPQPIPAYTVPDVTYHEGATPAVQLELKSYDIKANVLASTASIADMRTEISFTITDQENTLDSSQLSSHLGPTQGVLQLKTTKAVTPAQYSILRDDHQAARVPDLLLRQRSTRAIVHTKDIYNALKMFAVRLVSSSNPIMYLWDNSHIVITGPLHFGVSADMTW